MKLFAMTLLIGVFGLVAAGNHTAQDPLQVNPSIYNKKLENNRVRVFMVVFKPGQSIAVHKHPDHVVYAVKGGKIQINEVGKKSVTMDVPTGATVFLPAQSHSAKNLSKHTMRLLVVELK